MIRPWTAAEVTLARSLRADGLTTGAIASSLGRSTSSVRRKLWGLPKPARVVAPPKPKGTFTKAQIAYALANFRTDPEARALAHLITGIPA